MQSFAYSFINDHITIYNYYYLLLLLYNYYYYYHYYMLLYISNIKMENIEFKKLCIKNRTCYYFDDVIKLENLNIDNIFIAEKSHENILIYDISYKT